MYKRHHFGLSYEYRPSVLHAVSLRWGFKQMNSIRHICIFCFGPTAIILIVCHARSNMVVVSVFWNDISVCIFQFDCLEGLGKSTRLAAHRCHTVTTAPFSRIDVSPCCTRQTASEPEVVDDGKEDEISTPNAIGIVLLLDVCKCVARKYARQTCIARSTAILIRAPCAAKISAFPLFYRGRHVLGTASRFFSDLYMFRPCLSYGWQFAYGQG